MNYAPWRSDMRSSSTTFSLLYKAPLLNALSHACLSAKQQTRRSTKRALCLMKAPSCQYARTGPLSKHTQFWPITLYLQGCCFAFTSIVFYHYYHIRAIFWRTQNQGPFVLSLRKGRLNQREKGTYYMNVTQNQALPWCHHGESRFSAFRWTILMPMAQWKTAVTPLGITMELLQSCTKPSVWFQMMFGEASSPMMLQRPKIHLIKI